MGGPGDVAFFPEAFVHRTLRVPWPINLADSDINFHLLALKLEGFQKIVVCPRAEEVGITADHAAGKPEALFQQATDGHQRIRLASLPQGDRMVEAAIQAAVEFFV